jgi:type IV secretion system protein VirB10
VSGPEREAEATEAIAPAPADAQPFRLGGEPPQVMRLSRKALAILGAASGVVIGGALLYALQPTKPKVAENLYDSDRPNRSERVTGAPGDYGKIPKLGEPLPGDLGRPILAARENGETVPVPPIGAPQPPDPNAAAAERARLQAAQERESALSSQLFLGGAVSAASRPPASGADAPETVPPAPQTDSTAADKRRSFLKGGSGSAAESLARVAVPSSPHIVQAGSVLPAALITGIRSDLPGQVTAQVTQNVYDSPTGQILLIPQGARLIGEYASDISAGQNRVLLAWDRLILPEGRSIELGRMPGADAAGMAGLADRTNHHWGNLLRAALVSTLLGAGAEFGSDGEGAIVRALRDGSQDTINQTGRRVVERQMNIAPTLTIRPGFVLRVLVTRDLILEPQTGGAS